MLADEQLAIKRDCRLDFADECNLKAANGKRTPAVSQSVEEQIGELLSKMSPDGWSLEAVRSAIINKIPEWSKTLVPFVDLSGPTHW